MLLATYGHEDDISYTRDRKLAQLENSIKASEETLKSLRAVLTRLETQASEESRGGKTVPPQTVKNIAQTKNQIANHEAVVQNKRQEQEAVRKQAAADLERYRELKKHRHRQKIQKNPSAQGSTQRGPDAVSSCFQNGARVLSASMM